MSIYSSRSARSYGIGGTPGVPAAATIQTALDAMQADGGGIITLDSPRGAAVWDIDRPVYVRSKVGLCGEGGATVIRLTSPTACVRLGDGASNRPESLQSVTIDANGTGEPTGRLQVAAASTLLSQVRVTGAGATGVGVRYNDAQNTLAHNLVSSGFTAAALRMDNGAGGNTFHGGWLGDSGTSVHLTDTIGETNYGYPKGPSFNNWYGTICENYTLTGHSIVRAEAGIMNVLHDCLLSANGALVLSSGALVELSAPIYPTNATVLGIDGGQMQGAGRHKGITLVGTYTRAQVTGHAYLSNLTDFAYQRGGAGVLVHEGPTLAYPGALTGAMYASDLLGSTAGWVTPIK